MRLSILGPETSTREYLMRVRGTGHSVPGIRDPQGCARSLKLGLGPDWTGPRRNLGRLIINACRYLEGDMDVLRS